MSARNIFSWLSSLKKVLSLHTETLQIVLPSNGGIRDIPDFKGRRVSTGSRGSGTSLITGDLVAAFGLKDHDFIKAESITMDLQAGVLCNGGVDAFVVMSAVPNTNVTDAIDRCGAQLMPLQGPEVNKLLSRSNGLMTSEIPAGAYPNLEAPVPSIGVHAGLITRANMPDHVVREVVAAVIDELALLRESHSSLTSLDAKQLASPDHGAPLHPAAEAYFREQGLR